MISLQYLTLKIAQLFYMHIVKTQTLLCLDFLKYMMPYLYLCSHTHSSPSDSCQYENRFILKQFKRTPPVFGFSELPDPYLFFHTRSSPGSSPSLHNNSVALRRFFMQVHFVYCICNALVRQLFVGRRGAKNCLRECFCQGFPDREFPKMGVDSHQVFSDPVTLPTCR